jgi:hypothetical protein
MGAPERSKTFVDRGFALERSIEILKNRLNTEVWLKSVWTDADL